MSHKVSRSLFPFLAAAVLVLAASFGPAWAGGYLKMGEIKGESTDKAHPEWVLIDSLRITPQRRENARPAMRRGDNSADPVGTDPQAAATAGAAEPEEAVRHEPLVVVRKADTSSGQLEQAFRDGTRFASVTVSMPDASRPGKYMRYDLDDVLVTDYSRAAGSAAQETVALSYGRIAVVADTKPSRKPLDLKKQEELEAQAEAAANADSQAAEAGSGSTGSAARDSDGAGK